MPVEKMTSVIINIPMVIVKSRYEPIPYIESSGGIAHNLVVRIPANDQNKINSAMKEGNRPVVGKNGLFRWFKRIKQKYEVVG